MFFEAKNLYRSGLGNLFIITGRMNCALSLEDQNQLIFILKFYHYLTMRKSVFSWPTIQVNAYYRASFWHDLYSILG